MLRMSSLPAYASMVSGMSATGAASSSTPQSARTSKVRLSRDTTVSGSTGTSWVPWLSSMVTVSTSAAAVLAASPPSVLVQAVRARPAAAKPAMTERRTLAMKSFLGVDVQIPYLGKVYLHRRVQPPFLPPQLPPLRKSVSKGGGTFTPPPSGLPTTAPDVPETPVTGSRAKKNRPHPEAGAARRQISSWPPCASSCRRRRTSGPGRWPRARSPWPGKAPRWSGGCRLLRCSRRC